MKLFLKSGLWALLGLVLTVSAAHAIEYNDVLELTQKGVSDRTIVQLIVDDGRAFEMTDSETADLRDQGVSEIVIEAMLDPQVGADWLAGDYNPDTTTSGGGYSTSLDQAYGQGYGDGYDAGRTALVYSFGYYYGPLSRYYYCDPFYYSFYFSGYGYDYWPSYCAYYWRPAAWYYPYPYNWYRYDSFYCYTYYDPGYYTWRGYHVRPGGWTIWDNGPRWRDGGIEPPKGGRPRDLADGGRTRTGARGDLGNTFAPPVVREAIAVRDGGTPRERGSRVAMPETRGTPNVIRGGGPTRGELRPGDNGRVQRGERTVMRQPVQRGEPARRVLRQPVQERDRSQRLERTRRVIVPRRPADRVQRDEPKRVETPRDRPRVKEAPPREPDRPAPPARERVERNDRGNRDRGDSPPPAPRGKERGQRGARG